MDRGAQLLNATVNFSFGNQNFSLDHRHGDIEKRFATIVAEKVFFWNKLGAFEENGLRFAGIGRGSNRTLRDRPLKGEQRASAVIGIEFVGKMGVRINESGQQCGVA